MQWNRGSLPVERPYGLSDSGDKESDFPGALPGISSSSRQQTGTGWGAAGVCGREPAFSIAQVHPSSFSQTRKGLVQARRP